MVTNKREAVMSALDSSLIMRFKMIGKRLNKELIIAETLPFLHMPVDLAKDCVAKYIVCIHHSYDTKKDWLRTKLWDAYDQAKEEAPSNAVSIMERNKRETEWYKIMNGTFI